MTPAEILTEIHDDQQKARVKRDTSNRIILALSKIRLEPGIGPDVVLIRDPRYPGVDFFPALNKWRTGTGYLLGDASALIAYLEKRRRP